MGAGIATMVKTHNLSIGNCNENNNNDILGCINQYHYISVYELDHAKTDDFKKNVIIHHKKRNCNASVMDLNYHYPILKQMPNGFHLVDAQQNLVFKHNNKVHKLFCYFKQKTSMIGTLDKLKQLSNV